VNEVKDFIIDFLSVFYEAFPFIVLGSLIAGVLEEIVPQQFFGRVIPRNRFLAIALSALLGIVFPMCECGIVPVMRRMLRKGLPLGCSIAYMLAGPIINGVVFLSTWVAFKDHWAKGGYQIIALRMGLGYIVAVSTASLVEFILYRRYGAALLQPSSIPQSVTATNDDLSATAKERRSIWKRLGAISETALHDFMDITIFLTLGAIITSFARQTINMSEVAAFSTSYPGLAIAVMMALAIVMCLCSEADAFVAASFTDLHPSAKLAFLVLGPMLDIKLLLLFTRVFKPKLIVFLVISLIVHVFLIMMIIHQIWDVVRWPSPLNPIVAR